MNSVKTKGDTNAFSAGCLISILFSAPVIFLFMYTVLTSKCADVKRVKKKEYYTRIKKITDASKHQGGTFYDIDLKDGQKFSLSHRFAKYVEKLQAGDSIAKPYEETIIRIYLEGEYIGEIDYQELFPCND